MNEVLILQPSKLRATACRKKSKIIQYKFKIIQYKSILYTNKKLYNTKIMKIVEYK